MQADGLDRLANSFDVEDALVASLDGRVMMQNANLRVEVADAESVVRVDALSLGDDGVYKTRSLPDLSVLNGLRVLADGFDVQANGGHGTGLRDVHSVLVDALHRNRSEVSVPVGSEHHLLTDLHSASQNSASEDEADALREISRVNDELRSYLSLCHLLSSELGSDARSNCLGLRHSSQEASQEINTLASATGDGENGADLASGSSGPDLLDVLHGLDDDGDLLAVLLHDLDHFLEVLLVDLLGSYINLSEDHKDRQVQGERNAEMLLGHLRNAHVGADHQHAVVGEQGSQAVHRRLQVLLVATHVEQVNDSAGVFNDVGP
mmetsp:Transcript_33039/g.50630  ORF Transcript_33039/g.50630 Transcript_33039/m.50630 type:complete len:322 (-) Transcript_33039:394-1359(-)